MQHLKSSNINVKSKNLSNLLSISSQLPSEYQTTPASENQFQFWEVKYKKKEKLNYRYPGFPVSWSKISIKFGYFNCSALAIGTETEAS